jgi:hypothetical protein
MLSCPVSRSKRSRSRMRIIFNRWLWISSTSRHGLYRRTDVMRGRLQFWAASSSYYAGIYIALRINTACSWYSDRCSRQNLALQFLLHITKWEFSFPSVYLYKYEILYLPVKRRLGPFCRNMLKITLGSTNECNGPLWTSYWSLDLYKRLTFLYYVNKC